MFNIIKQIFEPNNKDIRKRILFTLGVLLIFSIGTFISVPGGKPLGDGLGFMELINAMSGGAYKQFSIFAVGVMPYISASIIMQLLQMGIVPYVAELGKQGEEGRRKINQITRYLGIIFSFFYGYAYGFAFLENATPISLVQTAIIFTGGTAFLLWLGDQITQKGVGNGISLIIMAGIISRIPSIFIESFNGLVVFGSPQETLFGIVKFLIFVAFYLLIVVGVIFVQQAERRIPIQYANRSNSSYGGKQTFLPLRVNSAGVIPVIFASALIMVPATIAQVSKSGAFAIFVQKYINYTSPVGLTLYLLLILFFAYFYAFVQIKPKELSENLQKNGGFIPGIRPGKETEEHINKVLSRLTLIGAVFLMVVSAIPILFNGVTNLSTNIVVGGTGLLIVVGVALDTYKQIESSLISRNYRRR